MKSIYLCGFMGCGKSLTGKILSRRMKMKLIDLDSYIVEQEKMSIPRIFEEKGEAAFRNMEAKYIRELGENHVVATGGGAILRNETALYAKENGIVFFISTDFETCYSRIKDDKNRPLVQKNTKEQLKELYDMRYPIYKDNSDFTVNGQTDAGRIATEIMRLYRVRTTNADL